jgi:transposase
LKTDNRAGQAFRQAAACVIRSRSAFGTFYRRKRAQLGPMQVQVATAHNIARTVYHLFKHKTAYHVVGAKAYEQQAQDCELVHLRKTAAKLGYTLTATAP